jgi:hypothetical protein
MAESAGIRCPRPSCGKLLVMNPKDPRPCLGHCVGCDKDYSVSRNGTANALCGCGVPHELGHPYSVGEARAAFDAYGKHLEPYMRSLFLFLLKKCERAKSVAGQRRR